MVLAVPVILCGKHPEVAQPVMERLAPEYDVIHVITSLDAGLSELPQLLAGDAIRPSSGLGSNAKNASISMSGRAPQPKLVIVGRGFATDEVDQLHALAKSLPWLLPSNGPTPDSSVKPVHLADAIATRMKSALKAQGLVPGHEDGPGEGTIWEW